MPDLDLEPWPIDPVVTDRLILRETRAVDVPGFVELLTSPVVREFLGGAASRERAEQATAGPPRHRPGCFVVRERASGSFVGVVELDRRDADRPGKMRPGGGDLEVSYSLLPQSWGRGYAEEATRAVLTWASIAVDDPHVIAVTQSANTRSVAMLHRLDFTEVDRFVEFGAEQLLFVRRLT